jgi:hypothetical protein
MTSYIIYLSMDASNISYYDGSWHDTGYDVAENSWVVFEFYNINTTTHKFSCKYGTTEIISSGGMWHNTGYPFFYLAGCTASYNYYVDNLLITNWRITEPSWGSWGAEQTN